MKKLIINNVQEYEAEKIVKSGNTIRLYNNGELELTFPNIANINEFQLGEGQEWDISEEDEQALYQIDLDFRISMLEMGVNTNDL